MSSDPYVLLNRQQRWRPCGRAARFLGAQVWCLTVLAAPAEELIVNGGFEDTGGTFVPNGEKLMSLLPGATTIPGWTTSNAELIWARNDSIYAQSPFGTFFVDLTGYHDAVPYGGVYQTIVTTPGRSYRVSLNIGTQESTPVYAGPVSVVIVVGGVTNQTLTFSPSGVGNQWAALTTDFLAGSNSTVVTIIGTASAGGAAIGLDEVSVVALPPRLLIAPAGAGQVQFWWFPEPGFVLQETWVMSPANWTNSTSGATNPIVVPTTVPTKFYRLFKP